jgi:hypothetical protein
MINWPRSEAVRTLRRLGDARNAFPIHTRSDRLLEAFCDLGVDFAATDWRFGARDEGGLPTHLEKRAAEAPADLRRVAARVEEERRNRAPCVARAPHGLSMIALGAAEARTVRPSAVRNITPFPSA